MKGLKSAISALLKKKSFWLSWSISACILLSVLAGCCQKSNQRIVPYEPEAWLPRIWISDPPEGCPFEPSQQIKGIAFTRRYANYTDADTWYPSWAEDGNMYSGWTDGEIGKESCHSSGGAKARTGNAKIIGDDPLNLTIISLGTQPASALPYGGRYPSANLVHDGIWYYGTYCIDFDFSKPEYPEQYSWAICGPVPGFRISMDHGQTWISSPLSPENPLFPETGKNGRQVKMGTPHFVDFGQNLEHSPDGKAYLVGHGLWIMILLPGWQVIAGLPATPSIWPALFRALRTSMTLKPMNSSPVSIQLIGPCGAKTLLISSPCWPGMTTWDAPPLPIIPRCINI